jgi:hypothetical protein
MGILSSVSQVLISQTRATSAAALALQRRGDWSRLTDLLAAETNEGRQFLRSQPMPQQCNNGGSSLFTIEVPVFDDAADSLEPLAIHYYQTGSGADTLIRRCGPRVTETGTLNPNPDTQSFRDEAVIKGVPISVTEPTECSQCLVINSAFQSEADNRQLTPVYLRSGIRQVFPANL